MFYGENISGKQFDVINEEFEVLGSFENLKDAVSCGKNAHWSNGDCNIRKDRAITQRLYADSKKYPRGLVALGYL